MINKLFDDLYISETGYIYSFKKRKMFKAPKQLVISLLPYSGIDELKEKDNILYLKWSNVISSLMEEGIEQENEGSFLDTLQLIVGNECNLACKYCYANCGTYNCKKNAMAFYTAKNAIDIMFKKYNRIDKIVFFGGEPFLFIETIEQICEYLDINYKGKYSFIGLMSNMYMLNERIINVIKKYDIQVSTSYDGNGELNKYRVTKNGKNCAKTIVKNINRLYYETGQPKAVEVTISDVHNEKNLNKQDVIDRIKSEIPIENYTVNEMIPFSKDMEDHVYKTGDIKSFDINDYLCREVVSMELNDFIGVIKGKACWDRFCYAGITKMTIYMNGDIYPCQMYCIKPNALYKMGNVNRFSEEEFVKGKDYIDKISKKSDNECKRCHARLICSQCLGINTAKGELICQNREYCKRTVEYMYSLLDGYFELLSDSKKMADFKAMISKNRALCR